MTNATVLLDTNVFTAWLRPYSTLLPLYGKHGLGRRIAIAQQTVAEVRYGAIAANWARGDSRPWNDFSTAFGYSRSTSKRLGRMWAPN